MESFNQRNIKLETEFKNYYHNFDWQAQHEILYDIEIVEPYKDGD